MAAAADVERRPPFASCGEAADAAVTGGGGVRDLSTDRPLFF